MAETEAASSADFAERMMRMLNEAALALMVSVGHRTGLFDVMAAMPETTSAEIASGAALDERYVREWLAVMTTGGIVKHDGAIGTFSPPADRAAWLTRSAGPDNLAIQAHIEDVLAADDKVALRLRLRGTHSGEFMGFPATGRTIEYVSHEFYRIADGLIAEEWICSDVATLFRQLS